MCATRSARCGRIPGFTAVVLLTLALGIGANAAIFSVVNGVILRPLAYRDANRLMVIWGDLHRPGVQRDARLPPASPWTIAIAATPSSRSPRTRHAGLQPHRQRRSGARRRRGRHGESLFAVGVSHRSAARFSAEEEQPGRGDVVMLSHAIWVRRFSANPAIVGQSVLLDGQPSHIVGVMPAALPFPTARSKCGSRWCSTPRRSATTTAGSHGYTVLAV